MNPKTTVEFYNLIVNTIESNKKRILYATSKATQNSFVRKDPNEIYALKKDLKGVYSGKSQWEDDDSLTIIIGGKALSLNKFFKYKTPQRPDIPMHTGGYLNKGSRAKIQYNIRKNKTEHMPPHIFTARGTAAYRTDKSNKFGGHFRSMKAPSVPDMIRDDETNDILETHILEFMIKRMGYYLDKASNGAISVNYEII